MFISSMTGERGGELKLANSATRYQAYTVQFGIMTKLNNTILFVSRLFRQTPNIYWMHLAKQYHLLKIIHRHWEIAAALAWLKVLYEVISSLLPCLHAQLLSEGGRVGAEGEKES